MPVSPDHPSAPTRNDRPGARPRGLSTDTQETAATQETAIATRLDFGDDDVYSAFTNPDVLPEDVDGGVRYTMTLKPGPAEALADDVDATYAAIGRALVGRLGMPNEGVVSEGGEGTNEQMVYTIISRSRTDPSKTVEIRLPKTREMNKLFITISSAIPPNERETAVYDIGAVIMDMTSPLEDDYIGDDDELLTAAPVEALTAPVEALTAPEGVLTGPQDKNLTFYEKINPVFSLDEIRATPMPINNTVFDPAAHEDVSLTDFMLAGNKLVFLFAGKQTGISYTSLIKTIKDGDGIFYECTREVSSSEITEGKYGFHEVYSQPYIEVLSRFYVTLDEFQKLLRVPVHPYWEIKDTGKTLPVTASRLNLAVRRPVQSQLHCQAGSDLKVYTIEPYMPQIDKDEEEDACEVPQIVTLQRGEVRTQVDISENNTVIGAKEWYARENALEVAKLRFIFRGKVMSDDGVLTPGTVVMVMIIPDRPPPEEQEQDQPPEGARRTRRRRRRNTNKNTRHR